MTRRERQREEARKQEEAKRRAREEKREDQELRLNDLAIGRRRFGLIARYVLLVVAVAMTVLGAPHARETWVPLIALGLMGV